MSIPLYKNTNLTGWHFLLQIAKCLHYLNYLGVAFTQQFRKLLSQQQNV